MTVFLLPTYRDPALLERVVARLAPHPVIVHVDAKVDQRPFEEATAAESDRVRFLSDRVLVNWAGWSQVVAARRLVRAGLEVAADDEYIVMLSGSDYPIKPVTALDDHLTASAGRQHLNAFDVLASGSVHYRRLLTGRHFRDIPLLQEHTLRTAPRLVRNTVIRMLEYAARALPRRRPPHGLVPAHGAAHFALTAACLRDLEATVTPDIERFFRAGVFSADENFYHSLLASGGGNRWDWSPTAFEGRGQFRYANLHHIDSTQQKVYTIADWPTVATCDRFFIRKVESERSRSLLDRIDRELLESGQTAPAH